MSTSCKMISVPLLAVAILCGCGGGSGPVLYSVEGTVTYDGKPIPTGLIVFEPAESVGLIAPSSYERINAGVFKSKSKALAKGEHSVRIESYLPASSPNADEVPVELFKPFRMTVQIPLPGNKLAVDVPKSVAKADKTGGKLSRK